MTPADVAAAAQRLRGVAHRTPVLRSRFLDEACNAEVFLKCENFQRGGAFKFRGAYNFLAQIPADRRSNGVVAYSSGNHAQGVALAASILGIPSTIVMPSDAPAIKLAATRGYGAGVLEYDRASGAREALAAKIGEETGATVVPPFDDERIAAGAGTAALELLEETGALDAIVVPLGGGGLLAGSAVAAHGVDPDVAIFGVEPEAGDDFGRSLDSGERVQIPVPQTIADGLQTTSPGVVTFRLACEHRARALTVNDAALVDAMRFAFERLKIVIEPSGAAGLAALLQRRVPRIGDDGVSGSVRRVGVIITGGNVDAARFAELMMRSPVESTAQDEP